MRSEEDQQGVRQQSAMGKAEPPRPRSGEPEKTLPLDDVSQPSHLGIGKLRLVRENVALAHPPEIDLIVGGDHGQRSLHPNVDSTTEFALYVATQGSHTGPRGPPWGMSTTSRSQRNSATASDNSISSVIFRSTDWDRVREVWVAVSRSFSRPGKRMEALSYS
jgi:hypothetical protein